MNIDPVLAGRSNCLSVAGLLQGEADAVSICGRPLYCYHEHVRDWATFGLGQQTTLDTPAIREALTDRLTDENYDTRCEAIKGLALRGDRQVIPVICEEMTLDSVSYTILEAIAAIPDPQFYSLLVAMRDEALQQISDINKVIDACRPVLAENLKKAKKPKTDR